MKPVRTALSLYVALALHLLVILLLALAPLPQLPLGSGSGLDEPGAGASAPATSPTAASSLEAPPRVIETAESLGLMAAPVQLRTPPAPSAPEAPRPPPAEAVMPRPASGVAGVGGGRGGYLSDLRRHLSRHRRALPGVVASARSDVAFTVEPDGRVSSLGLQRSSGVAALDAEAVALIQRAAPLPLPPQGRSLRLVVPVQVEERALVP